MSKPFRCDIPRLQLGLFDIGGVLYHARYFTILETMREEFLSQRAMPYAELVAAHSHLAIAESHQSFLKPVRYGDEVRGELTASQLQRASVRLNYELFRDDQLIHQAWTRLVHISVENNGFRPSPLPPLLRSAFEGISQNDTRNETVRPKSHS